MKARCENENDPKYPRYGARGITVCDRWRNSFENFFADMGPRPSKLHTIDRKDNDLGYSPNNCRWATKKEQQRNMSRNHKLTVRGETKTIAEWAEIQELNPGTIHGRLRRGLSDEAAVQNKKGDAV